MKYFDFITSYLINRDSNLEPETNQYYISYLEFNFIRDYISFANLRFRMHYIYLIFKEHNKIMWLERYSILTFFIVAFEVIITSIIVIIRIKFTVAFVSGVAFA